MAVGGKPGLGCPALSPRTRGPIRGVGAGAQAWRDPTSSSRHQGQEPPQPQCLTAPFSLGRLLHSFTPQPSAWPSLGLPTLPRLHLSSRKAQEEATTYKKRTEQGECRRAL